MKNVNKINKLPPIKTYWKKKVQVTMKNTMETSLQILLTFKTIGRFGEQCYAYTVNNLNEMHKFTEKAQFAKTAQET